MALNDQFGENMASQEANSQFRMFNICKYHTAFLEELIAHIEKKTSMWRMMKSITFQRTTMLCKGCIGNSILMWLKNWKFIHQKHKQKLAEALQREFHLHVHRSRWPNVHMTTAFHQCILWLFHLTGIFSTLQSFQGNAAFKLQTFWWKMNCLGC